MYWDGDNRRTGEDENSKWAQVARRRGYLDSRKVLIVTEPLQPIRGLQGRSQGSYVNASHVRPRLDLLDLTVVRH